MGERIHEPWRLAVMEFIREQAKPADKYGHQPRLYSLTKRVGDGLAYDDDVVFAAVWLHDLGVFIGHRPEAPAELSRWDHVAYAVQQVPGILQRAGFPIDKIPHVLEVIRTHQPNDEPKSIEATIVRDADILEQLGCIGVLRSMVKVGRDTRYSLFSEVLPLLERAVIDLPGKLRLSSAKDLAHPKVAILLLFLKTLREEAVPELY